jgi:hypothetical protein
MFCRYTPQIWCHPKALQEHVDEGEVGGRLKKRRLPSGRLQKGSGTAPMRRIKKERLNTRANGLTSDQNEINTYQEVAFVHKHLDMSDAIVTAQVFNDKLKRMGHISCPAAERAERSLHISLAMFMPNH